MAGVPLPPFLRPQSQQCERCGLRYPKRAEQCPHCADLDDSQLHSLKSRVAEEQEGQAALGRTFFIIAAVLAAVVLALLLEL